MNVCFFFREKIAHFDQFRVFLEYSVSQTSHGCACSCVDMVLDVLLHTHTHVVDGKHTAACLVSVYGTSETVMCVSAAFFRTQR